MNALAVIKAAEQQLKERFQQMEEVAYQNQAKIIESFKEHRVREYHFNTTTGYGYGDDGRDLLESIYAHIFEAEDAIVRQQLVSGTHAISACLFGLLYPGDQLISIIGPPYDTLGNVIGKEVAARGTLIERGIKYSEVPLDLNGGPDFKAIAESVTDKTTMVLIQRSRGYTLRPALNIEQIKRLVLTVKERNQQTIVMVDNCYGEFTDTIEPIACGADIVAGSLIKNPGGGLAPSGGYIVGKKELINRIAYHITAPFLGKSLGASLANKRLFFQGLFLAPHVVLQSLKGACLFARIFEVMGYDVYPKWDEPRGDIVQAIKFDSPKEVLEFCQIIQNCSPVDSDVNLEYAAVPGYSRPIVMAAGTFVQGSSIELSCDAPFKEPYSVFLQGGLTYEHCRYAAHLLIQRFNGI